MQHHDQAVLRQSDARVTCKNRALCEAPYEAMMESIMFQPIAMNCFQVTGWRGSLTLLHLPLSLGIVNADISITLDAHVSLYGQWQLQHT